MQKIGTLYRRQCGTIESSGGLLEVVCERAHACSPCDGGSLLRLAQVAAEGRKNRRMNNPCSTNSKHRDTIADNFKPNNQNQPTTSSHEDAPEQRCGRHGGCAESASIHQRGRQ